MKRKAAVAAATTIAGLAVAAPAQATEVRTERIDGCGNVTISMKHVGNNVVASGFVLCPSDRAGRFIDVSIQRGGWLPYGFSYKINRGLGYSSAAGDSPNVPFEKNVLYQACMNYPASPTVIVVNYCTAHTYK